MSRSVWKPPLSYTIRYTKPIAPTRHLKKGIKVWSRYFMISPYDLGKEFHIYNGKRWVLIKIVEEMVGHKFGEFCSTRKRILHNFEKRGSVHNRQSHRKKAS